MMQVLDIVGVLKKVALLSKNAASLSLSRGEQATFLHQTLLSISNILDHEEDRLHRSNRSGENPTVESFCIETSENAYPSTILQLYTQRLALPINAKIGGQTVSSLTNRDGVYSSAEQSIVQSLVDVIVSLDNLCHHKWKHLFEYSQVSDPKCTESDPFSKDHLFIDVQHQKLLLQQLDAVQKRCMKLVEEERAILALGSSCLAREKKEKCSREVDEKRMSLEECTWRIRERLAGYEECIDRLLGDLWDWKGERNLGTLEISKQLLIHPRWVERLMTLALDVTGEKGEISIGDGSGMITRVLKLSSDCFAALPLPLQSKLFQWLWDQPNGHNLFQYHAVINVNQELTHVFNRLVTGSTDSQLTERAREICSIALHCSRSTLRKAILEAVGNEDAGKLICKVLWYIPFLTHLQDGSTSCFLSELSSYLKTLHGRELSSNEETNLYKFVHAVIQCYPLPNYPGPPITYPPLVRPLLLADSCIWPFLGPTSKNHSLRAGPHPGFESHVDSHRVTVPPHVILKLLNIVLTESLSSNKQSQGLLDTSVCFSTLLTLCNHLHECTVTRDNGEVMNSFLIKEMTFDLLQRISSYVQEFHTEVLSPCVEWLQEEITHLDWTVRLSLHSLFSRWIPSSQKEVNSCIEAITGSLHKAQPITESVPQYVAWGSSLVAFFQGARISSHLSEQFVKGLSRNLQLTTASSRVDFYRAVCLALSQVLPLSTSSEWLVILGTLELMKAEGLLCIVYTSQFMTSLPAFDITMVQKPLQLSQVFTTVIQLLSSMAFSDWLKDNQWQHITKTYTQVIKTVVSNSSESISSSSAPSSHVFLIGQLFCQSCEVSRCVPESAAEQIFVWCLELVTRLEEILGCHGNDDSDISDALKDMTFHEIKAINRATEYLQNSGQKSTLQQKLSVLSSRC